MLHARAARGAVKQRTLKNAPKAFPVAPALNAIKSGNVPKRYEGLLPAKIVSSVFQIGAIGMISEV